jgi:hypothetical protein
MNNIIKYKNYHMIKSHGFAVFVAGVCVYGLGTSSYGGLNFMTFGLLMYHMKKREIPLKAIPIKNISITLNQ